MFGRLGRIIGGFLSSGGGTNQIGTRNTANTTGTGDIKYTVVGGDYYEGPSEEQVVALIKAARDANPPLPPPKDFHADINAACTYLHKKPDVALVLLQNLKTSSWHEMDGRQKYRVLANLGTAHEETGEFREAARLYFESKTYQPKEERARALEAVGHFLLGEKAKALEVATSVIADFPYSTIAHAVRLRLLDLSESELDTLIDSVPIAIRHSPEVLFALGWRLLFGRRFEAAESVARDALKQNPELPHMREIIGYAIIQQEAQKQRPAEAAPLVNRDRLLEGIRMLADVGVPLSEKEHLSQTHTFTAIALALLGNDHEAESEFRKAVSTAPQVDESRRNFALFLVKRDRNDTAIDVLSPREGWHQSPQCMLMLASLLSDRGGTGDRELAIQTLRPVIQSLTKYDVHTRAGSVDLVTRLLAMAGNTEEAQSVLAKAEPPVLPKAIHRTIRADVLRMTGDRAAAVAAIKEALAESVTALDLPDRLRAAAVLSNLGLKKEAVEVWKTIIVPGKTDMDFVRSALNAAHSTEDSEYVLEVCEVLRNHGVLDPFCLELELVTLHGLNASQRALDAIAQYLATDNPDPAYCKTIRARRSLLGIELMRPELIEQNKDLLPTVEEVQPSFAGAVSHVLSNGPDPIAGVRFAYSCLRRSFLDHIAHESYILSLRVDNGEHEIVIPNPETAGPGSAVLFKDDLGQLHWRVIEDEQQPPPDVARHEIACDNPIAVEITGKRVGDAFVLRNDDFQSIRATVIEIRSKYSYRVMDAIEKWEERFPQIPFIRRYQVATKPTGEPDLDFFFKAAEQRDVQVHGLHQTYLQRPISVSMLSQMTGHSITDSLSHLSSQSDLPIRCCRGTLQESNAAENSLRSAGRIVLDPSALATLWTTRFFRKLPHFKIPCVVSEGSLVQFHEALKQLDRKGGTFGKFRGQYFFDEANPEVIDRIRTDLTDFLAWIKSYASVLPGLSVLKLPSKTRDELGTLFGQAAVESVAIAREDGSVLWTDDFAIGEFCMRGDIAVQRVWTQILALWLADKSAITGDTLNDLTTALVTAGYHHTRIWTEAVLQACEVTHWNPDLLPLKAYMQWFTNPNTIVEGVVRIIAELLPRIWLATILPTQKEAVTSAILAAISRRPDGTAILDAFRQQSELIFRLDANSASRFREIIDTIHSLSQVRLS